MVTTTRASRVSKACLTCRHCFAAPKAEDQPQAYVCRLNPPQLYITTANQLGSHFPPVGGEMVCGQHERKLRERS